jgi:hypothetical protein
MDVGFLIVLEEVRHLDIFCPEIGLLGIKTRLDGFEVLGLVHGLNLHGFEFLENFFGLTYKFLGGNYCLVYVDGFCVEGEWLLVSRRLLGLVEIVTFVLVGGSPLIFVIVELSPFVSLTCGLTSLVTALLGEGEFVGHDLGGLDHHVDQTGVLPPLPHTSQYFIQ